MKLFPLIQQIAIILGEDEWKPHDHGSDRFYSLQNQIEPGFAILMDCSSKMIEVYPDSISMPVGHGESKNRCNTVTPYDYSGSSPQEIRRLKVRMNHERGASTLAREIEKRVLPEARRYYKACMDKYAEHVLFKDSMEALYVNLCYILGLKTPPETYQGREPGKPSPYDFRNGINLKLGNMEVRAEVWSGESSEFRIRFSEGKHAETFAKMLAAL